MNVKVGDDLFMSDNFKYAQVNMLSPDINTKNFLDCLKKSQQLLKSLETSMAKSSEYENRLLKCKKEHTFTASELRGSEASAPKNDQSTTDNTMSPRFQMNIVDSWSTMSVVCLQYQYEELCKRYESLLHAYDQRCDALNARDEALLRLRKRMNKTHRELMYVHQSLLCVGEKYLTLKFKKMSQKTQFKEKIEQLKETMYEVLGIVEQNRAELSEQVARCATMEHDTAVALLLAEIKKCNSLLLENLHLKSKLEILAIE